MNSFKGMPLRAARDALASENSKYSADRMVSIPRISWPAGDQRNLSMVFRSRQFLAQVYEEADGIVRISVIKAAIGDDGRWKDGIAWEQLQWIKAQCGFGNRQAVEIFPPDAHVVNVANMRHLWVLPEPLPFGWKPRQSA